MSFLKSLGDMDGKPILYATIIIGTVAGVGYLMHKAGSMKNEVLDCSKFYGKAASIHWRSRDDGSCHFEDFCHTLPGRCADRDDLAGILRHIELAEHFEKTLPPELLARIKATQAKTDPTCMVVMNVGDIPASFSVIYQKAERDNAGMLMSACDVRAETQETFYAGVHYPDPRLKLKEIK